MRGLQDSALRAHEGPGEWRGSAGIHLSEQLDNAEGVVSPFVLNLADFLSGTETCLVGRKNGEFLAAQLAGAGIRWEDLEADGSINIQVPGHILTVNASFFIAVWGRRIAALGSEEFLRRYSVQGSRHIREKIQDFVRDFRLYMVP